MNGSWDSGCDADIEDRESERSILTVSGSSFSQTENEWFDSTNCSGISDVTVNMSGTLVLGDELTATMGGSNFTATELDVVMNSFEGTVNNLDTASGLNAEQACGFNDWVAGTPKDLLGTSCGPDSDIKDLLYVDDTVSADIWYGGDEEGPVDANGFPTSLDSDAAKVRM